MVETETLRRQWVLVNNLSANSALAAELQRVKAAEQAESGDGTQRHGGRVHTIRGFAVQAARMKQNEGRR